MTNTDAFSTLPNVKFVSGESSSSVILAANGPADAHLEPLFAEYSLEGSGYDLGSIVHALVLTEDAVLLKRFRFDCEAGMFCAYGSDLEALYAVATGLERLLADTELVRSMLAVAQERDLFD
ncbi:Imm51 family immunity protein [Stackebrandtia soli]|uniref:Imm51 family immunity protein n=1 Tax=Stackebrandtia soli TaxID=1892856 RepID=UPI0039E9F3CD